MERTHLAGHTANPPGEHSAQARCHQPTTHRTFALAVAGLAAFAAVACLPVPLPGTASRAAGFPTGDPPPADIPARDDVFSSRGHAIDIVEACFDPFDIAMP
jgi:hypothetical protein